MRALGIWDLDRSRPSLGGLILFAAELLAVTAFDELPDIDILMSSSDHHNLGYRLHEDIALAIQGFTGISKVAIDVVDRFQIDMSGYDLVWPPKDDVGYEYGTTLQLQQIYANDGVLPSVRCNSVLHDNISRELDSFIDGRAMIAVHLKCDGQTTGESNACIGEWLRFFKCISISNKCAFILLGDDVFCGELESLNSVVRSRNIGLTLADDLAIIERADGFLGMSSGPSIMSVVGQKPYVIFKHPDHDVEQIRRELGDSLSFSFANERQVVLREFDTAHRIEAAFNKYIDGGNNGSWQVPHR